MDERLAFFLLKLNFIKIKNFLILIEKTNTCLSGLKEARNGEIHRDGLDPYSELCSNSTRGTITLHGTYEQRHLRHPKPLQDQCIGASLTPTVQCSGDTIFLSHALEPPGEFVKERIAEPYIQSCLLGLQTYISNKFQSDAEADGWSRNRL